MRVLKKESISWRPFFFPFLHRADVLSLHLSWSTSECAGLNDAIFHTYTSRRLSLRFTSEPKLLSLIRHTRSWKSRPFLSWWNISWQRNKGMDGRLWKSGKLGFRILIYLIFLPLPQFTSILGSHILLVHESRCWHMLLNWSLYLRFTSPILRSIGITISKTDFLTNHENLR